MNREPGEQLLECPILRIAVLSEAPLHFHATWLASLGHPKRWYTHQRPEKKKHSWSVSRQTESTRGSIPGTVEWRLSLAVTSNSLRSLTELSGVFMLDPGNELLSLVSTTHHLAGV